MASGTQSWLQPAASAGIGSLWEIPAPQHPLHSSAGPWSSPLALEAACSLGSVWGSPSPTRQVQDSL